MVEMTVACFDGAYPFAGAVLRPIVEFVERVDGCGLGAWHALPPFVGPRCSSACCGCVPSPSWGNNTRNTDEDGRVASGRPGGTAGVRRGIAGGRPGRASDRSRG